METLALDIKVKIKYIWLWPIFWRWMRIIPNRINWIRPGQSLALVSCGSMIKVAQTLEFFLNIHIFRTYCKNTPDHSTILCPANVEGLKRFQNHTILYSQTFRAASFHMLSLKPFLSFPNELVWSPFNTSLHLKSQAIQILYSQAISVYLKIDLGTLWLTSNFTSLLLAHYTHSPATHVQAPAILAPAQPN